MRAPVIPAQPTLLLVEADDELRGILSEVVAQLGFSSVAVATAETARTLLRIRSLRFELVLVDCECADGSFSTELLDVLASRPSGPTAVVFARCREAVRLARTHRALHVGPIGPDVVNGLSRALEEGRRRGLSAPARREVAEG